MSDNYAMVKRIAELPDLGPDEYIETVMQFEAAERRMKDIKEQLLEARLEWHALNGDCELDDGRRYYAGTVKRTKCRDKMATAEAVLHATGVVIEDFVDTLSANAFKPGAAKKLLGGVWHDHFEVEEVADLKTGKAKQAIQLADDKFLTR